MKRGPATPASEEVRLYRRAVTRLKREIGKVDSNARRRYIREFQAEFGSYQDIASFDDLLVDCLKADLIYIGDYHALPASQRFAARLLGEVASRSRQVALGMEMVFGRHQRILDRWLAGEISEEDFLRRIRYGLDWGYSWPSFQAVFEAAREYHCRVFGIDCEPRASFRFIRKRDRYAAARIVSLFTRGGASKVVAVVGESHLADRHLPARVRRGLKRARLEKRTVVVVQNMDEIYWRLAEERQQHVDVVRVGRGRYCALTAGLLEKYEAYRQTIERWKKEPGDEEVDLTPTVYNIIDTILEFLKVDKYRHCLVREKACIEFVVDTYPEVYSNADEALVRRLLRAEGLETEDEQEVVNHLGRRGSCYVPRLNAILIGEFNLVHAGEEAGHFVNLALKREIYERARREAPQHDQFYGSVIEEALAFFASKLVDPARNHFLESPFYRLYGKPREVIERDSGCSYAEFQEIIRFILLHKRLEQRYAEYERVPEEILKGIGAGRSRVHVLTHELGYYLGQQIYDGYRAGVLTRAEIAGLFRARFAESGSALKEYLALAERLAGQAAGTVLPDI
jgi:hypothetical protein